MFNNLNLEENTRYEVLVTTSGTDNSFHTKPLGILIKDDSVILNLYPNNTLKNIRDNPSFMVQLSSNPLVFTKALLSKLDSSNYNEEGVLKKSSCVLYVTAYDYTNLITEDKYGNTSITRIIAEVTDVMMINNTPCVINRATNKIMEFLVKLSRIDYMDKNELKVFKKEVDDSSKFIIKEGNQDHIDSLTLIKHRLNNYKKTY